MQRYFVIHLTDQDLKDRGREITENRYEIQILDDDGRAAACVYVGLDGVPVESGHPTVPSPVTDAARRQTLGTGEYVDECGCVVSLF